MDGFERRFREIRDYAAGKTKRDKAVLFLLAGLLLLALFFLSVWLVGTVIGSVLNIIHSQQRSALYYGLHDGLAGSLILWAVLIVLIILTAGNRRLRQNMPFTVDRKGLRYARDPVHGGSHYLNEKDAAKVFTIADIHDTVEPIYGQISNNGEKVVGWKKNPYGPTGDENVIVLGSPGTSKSFSLVRTNIIQAVLRGDSVVITDPKGELATDLGPWARSRGVDVQILNLDQLEFSDCWPMLAETMNPETERLDGERMQEFVNVFLSNIGDEKADFWYQSAMNLFTAIIGYTAWEHESYIYTYLFALYKRIVGSDPAYDREITQVANNQFISFPILKQMIREAGDDKKFDPNEIDQLIEDIENNAPAYTMGAIIENLLNLKTAAADDSRSSKSKYGSKQNQNSGNSEEAKIKSMPHNHPSWIAYSTYSTQDNAQIQASARQELLLKLQTLSGSSMRDVVSNKGINIGSINKKQCAWFIIQSDKSTFAKPIVSLFFSFIFKDAMDEYDREEQLSKEEGRPNERLPVMIMLDEFASAGHLYNFPHILSVCRSRRLKVWCILQNITQLEEVYGEAGAKEIETCCSTVLFLGCHDLETAEFISEFSSEATILDESHTETKQLLSDRASNNMQTHAVKRNLLTIGDVLTFSGGVERKDGHKYQILVMKAGQYPLELFQFPWIQHPVYLAGECKPVSPRHQVVSLSERRKSAVFKVDAMSGNAESDASGQIAERIQRMQPLKRRRKRVLAEGETASKRKSGRRRPPDKKASVDNAPGKQNSAVKNTQTKREENDEHILY